ncbi:Jag N-terminal domain-containing protein [bacterium]|nr:Jag N-terminal domain-containing protein [bacterium]
MEIIEEGKTVQEAITKALQKLNVSRDDVKIEILEKENKGLLKFMGMGKAARIKASLIKKPDKASEVKNFILEILKLMSINSNVEAKLDKGQIFINIIGEEDVILQDRGKILEAFQHLCNRMMNIKNEEPRIKVNVECAGYRKKQEESLRRLAYKLAEKAKKTGQNQRVNSLSPQNRRIIHITLENDKEIKTYSKGEGFLKTIIIEKVNSRNNSYRSKKPNN